MDLQQGIICSITSQKPDFGEECENFIIDKAAAVRNVGRQVETKVDENLKAQGHKNMIFGALWFLGGTIVTVVTLQAASGGGRYVVAWGAIVFGGIQFIRGLIQVNGQS